MGTKAGKLGGLCLLIALAGWPSVVLAQYTIVLKSGRRITVQSYREEKGMVKFHGFGGEVAIAKDQIQSIVKGAATGRPLSTLGELSGLPPAEDAKRGAAKPKAEKAVGAEGGEAAPPPEKPEDLKAKEEKAYQDKLRQINTELKAARERYALATRRSSGPEPTLLTSEEAIAARTEDLRSRLRDRQHSPSDPGSAKLLTPSPFSGQPPSEIELRGGAAAPTVDAPLPGYTAREKELSDLRARIVQLETDRQRLIEEMRSKGFNALFLE